MSDGRGFLEELKRRHVWRVAVAYAIAAWLLVQIATQVFPFFSIPSWVVRVVVILLALGFPAAVMLAWAFEMTPEGVRRTAPADSREARPEHERHRIGRKLNRIIVAVLVLAVALLGWRLYAVQSMTAATTARAVGPPASGLHISSATAPTVPIPAKSIAVLPFENLSGDRDNEYFVAGMQDLILTKLADIGDLKVIARTSTAKYASRPEDLKIIGRQLGVASILEGSVQKQGKQVLINVQLIDTRSDGHIWAQDYTRTLDDVFGVEGEVAKKIADALNARLSSAETVSLAAVPTRNQAAYVLFLRAEYYTNLAGNRGNPRIWSAAIPLYRQAIEEDPQFAWAFARLSYAESATAWFGGGGQDVKQLFAQARTDAERALKLAPDLAEAQLALGYNDYWGHLDYTGALQAFAAALALRPNDADALEAQGLAQRRMGRFDAAIASFERAFAQDPRHSVLAAELSETYMQAGRYPDAERWAQRALSLDPDNTPARENYVHSILFGSGDIPRALAAAETHSNGRLIISSRVPLLTLQRRYTQALQLLDSIKSNVPDKYLANVVVRKPQITAELYRLLGEPERARPLYAQVLPELRAQLRIQQGMNLAGVWSGVAEAELGLGRTAEGLDAIGKSRAIAAGDRNRADVPRLMAFNASLYAQARRPELAVPLIAQALATPGVGLDYSPVMLWLDPVWDPIRQDPRFQALLTQYAKDKPAVIPVAMASATH